MKHIYAATTAAAIAVVAVGSLIGAYNITPVQAQITTALPVASTVTTTTASAQLIGANPTRHGITFYNQGAVVVSILPGTGTATASGGGTINLAASGGTLTLICAPTLPCGNAFQGIAASSTAVVTMWEY